MYKDRLGRDQAATPSPKPQLCAAAEITGVHDKCRLGGCFQVPCAETLKLCIETVNNFSTRGVPLSLDGILPNGVSDEAAKREDQPWVQGFILRVSPKESSIPTP